MAEVENLNANSSHIKNKLLEPNTTGFSGNNLVSIFESALTKYYDNVPNGAVNDFRQGQIGDCYFVAALDAVSQDEDGKEIIKNSVNKKSDKTYEVTFAGDPNKRIPINETQIDQRKDNKTLSSGDYDVQIFEHGADNLIEDFGDGGQSQDSITLITGQECEVAYEIKDIYNLLNKADADTDGITMTAGFKQDVPDLGLLAHHAYSVIDVQKPSPENKEGKVVLHNPHDTSKELVLTYKEFCQNARKAAYQETE
jgi:hypothetical protein